MPFENNPCGFCEGEGRTTSELKVKPRQARVAGVKTGSASLHVGTFLGAIQKH